MRWLLSGGFKMGACDYSHSKHVCSRADEKGEVIVAKLLIYAD